MAKKYYTLAWSGNFTRDATSFIDSTFGGDVTAVGDFNGDGHQDLLANYVRWEYGMTGISGAPPGQQVLLLGRGDGTFIDGTATLPDGGRLEALIRKFAVGDFNGDGKDDLAMSLNWETGRMGSDPAIHFATLNNKAPLGIGDFDVA
jgi:hypothetical protein